MPVDVDTAVPPLSAGVLPVKLRARVAALTPSGLHDAIVRVTRPCLVVRTGDGALGLAVEPDANGAPPEVEAELHAWAPALAPESFGDAGFRHENRLRYNYLAGSMANGIGSTQIVEAMAQAGMLGFFGAAGLEPERIEAAIAHLSTRLLDRPWGANLIHSPSEPQLEEAVADLYLRRGVRLVEASAYLRLTLPLVRYRTAGIHREPGGRIVVPHRVIAKASRVEVARQFWSPPPLELLAALVERGDLTAEQAALAAQVPVAQDRTAEADSGGHTDNRPAITLLPAMLALRDRLQAEHGYPFPLRAGLAGGMATPASVRAGFALGAAWVLGGSIHQACRESGTSDLVRQMLAEAEQADTTMVPAADMFELGVKVQVLKRGTLFGPRAQKLYDLYRAHQRLEDLPAAVSEQLERVVFKRSLGDVWRETEAFFAARDPRQLERAARDPKHRMALVFRWYLGKSSDWARGGDPERRADFQVWCGPAMGAFNEWVRGSFLEAWGERQVVTVALNLLCGAAVLERAAQLRLQGVAVPALDPGPRPLARPCRSRSSASAACSRARVR